MTLREANGCNLVGPARPRLCWQRPGLTWRQGQARDWLKIRFEQLGAGARWPAPHTHLEFSPAVQPFLRMDGFLFSVFFSFFRFFFVWLHLVLSLCTLLLFLPVEVLVLAVSFPSAVRRAAYHPSVHMASRAAWARPGDRAEPL